MMDKNLLYFKMASILSIETSTKNCSVALSVNGITIDCLEISELGYSHAEKLHIFIQEILQKNNLNFSDLHAIAVGQGPGSYTGLRIGVSAAKGLCFALNIPLIAIDSLLILAKKLNIENGVLVPMLDARRMECYTGIYDNKWQNIQAVSALIIDENSFLSIKKQIHVFGDGALKCKNVLTDKKFIYHENILYPSASEMSEIAFDRFKKSDFKSVAYFEPFYLKDFMLTTSK